MSDDRSLLLEAVAEVARLAGKVALGYFKSGLTVETKSDGSPVTIADRAAEDAARSWIASRFPDDAVEGEERGANTVTSHRRWIIDPIDGTKTFVRGVPLWGSLVAVCEGNEVIAGAASFPAVGEELAAAIERVAEGDAVFSPRLAGFVLDAFREGGRVGGDAELDELTPREREVLQLIARGYMYKEIAARLHLSVKTVESHVSSVLRKLQLSTRHELARWATEHRLV